ncbi:sensory box histidine kinase [Aquipluma nitroreducens]|uniref:Sensory box histidine kinase n=1 Tax=Aquipluma nitroreducens TaxID=2010828 RepID=A0A5K7S652_9BACT|nr:response regulator [Aquipluma nitroreducens]BBE17002.1 sensory box histidine kinase [Aquipluma nitroreducens]
MKLLIVDDNPINQKFLYYSLKKYYEIETADNGLEAVEMLEKNSYDVVLMDLSMPVMDGAEATLRIRKSINAKNKHVPIIFVTTNDFEHDRTRCMKNGGSDYLIKPVDINELLNSINIQLNLRQEIF